MKKSALFMLAYFLIGCSDNLIYKVSENKPEIVVYPEEIDFGNLLSGQESGSTEIIIVNAGDGDLSILSPVLFDGSERFNIYGPEEEVLIAPGELLTLEAIYTPETYETNGSFVRIESNDEETPQIDVLMVGSGDAPVMKVTPDNHDYGSISIGCDNEERITIRNDGNLDLVIDSVTQMVTQPADIIMEYGSLPEPPWVLESGEEVDFLVSYVPNDIGYDESEITITSNDPLTPEIEVIQYGDGDVEKWFNQSYQQEEIPILDVLWVVDNSGSMNQFQTNLSTNISSFMNAFVQTGADYHMSVITTDTWVISSILTSSTPNVEQELSSLVMTGIHGSGMEKGIEMSYRALSSSSSAGPGSLFWRDDAILVVIYVSDEKDWSNPGWNSYINFFDTLKPVGSFKPYGVISDVPGGCQYTSSSGHVRSLQPGYGYWDLIDYYHGVWYSICAPDWGVQLQDLAGEVTGRRTFFLDEDDPIVDTIEVRVNGQITSEWEYDSSSNAVVFAEGHIPSEGQTVDIDYAVWGC